MRSSSIGRGSATLRTLCAAGAILAAVCGAQACSPGGQVAQEDIAAEDQAEIDRYERYYASALAAGRPSEADIDRLESQFAAVPCLGDAGRWDRTYFFGSNGARDAIDKDRIDFRLAEAGKYEFKPERHRVEAFSPEALGSIDDRDYRVAFGSYRISTRTFEIEACGANIG